jgi:serine/threonine protein kinase
MFIQQVDVDDIWIRLAAITPLLEHVQNVRVYLVEKYQLAADDVPYALVKGPGDYRWPEYAQFVPTCLEREEMLTVLFNNVIFKPLMEKLSSVEIDKIMEEACYSGQIEVFKLLITKGVIPFTMKPLGLVMKSLQMRECSDPAVIKLLDIIQLMCNLDKGSVNEYIQDQWDSTPRAVLLVLCKLSYPDNVTPEELILRGQGLVSLPSASIADGRFTHVSLEGNYLTAVPVELFQLQSLEMLDLSHNIIEKVPSILKWNCPKLHLLDLSYNQLREEKGTTIIQRSLTRRESLGPIDKNSVSQQKVLHLTTHNMYSCVHSLNDVNLGHNPELLQVPEWVCVLPHLTRLDLRGNSRLKELPKTLANFKDLVSIQVDPHTLTFPPCDVTIRGSHSIITFLRSHLKGISNYRHMNVFLLGMGGAGKTTLFDGLMGGAGQVTGSTGCYDYRGEVRDRTTIKATYHVTDISMQVFGSPVLQCFLMERCVYVCMWDLNEGKEGLAALVSVIRDIHAKVPDGQVMLLGTHHDQCSSQVSPADVLAWEREVFSVDNPQNLHDLKYANSHGLPRLFQPLLVNSNDSQHIEMVKAHIHYHAGDLRVAGTDDKVIDQVVPRSYTLLQRHIDSKAKGNCHVMRYGELIDSFRSTSHQSGNHSDDENEFTLACHFLHNSGALYRYHDNQQSTNQNDLFFLNFQWLTDMLIILLASCKASGIVSMTTLTSLLASYGLAPFIHHPLVSIMISNSLIIPQDQENNYFIVPSLFPASIDRPPLPHPLVARKVSFSHLPQFFFHHFISHLLGYIDLLGAQLVMKSGLLMTDVDYLDQMYIRSGNSFKLVHGDYLSLNLSDESSQKPSISRAIQMMKPLSYNRPPNDALKASLKKKIGHVSKSFQHKLPKLGESNQWKVTTPYSRSLLWQHGIHAELINGTSFKVYRSGRDDVMILVSGEAELCIKGVEFLIGSLQHLCEELYVNVTLKYESPCTNCSLDESSINNLYFFPITCTSLTCPGCSHAQTWEGLAPESHLKTISDQYRLDVSKLSLDETPSHHSLHSEIYDGLYDGKRVMVAMFKSNAKRYISAVQMITAQFNIMSNLSHENIATPIGVTADPLSIVYPRGPVGSLKDHLELCPDGIDDRLSHSLLHQVAEGMKYLHSLVIIHGDINPQNILIWSLHHPNSVHVKIGDSCGLMLHSELSGFPLRGTEGYMAPELYTSASRRPYTEKTDVYGFGVVVFNVVTGKRHMPSTAANDDRKRRSMTDPTSLIGSAIEKRRLRGTPRDVPSDLLVNGIHPASRQGHITMCISTCMQSLMDDCTSVNPSRRPTADGIAGRLMVCIGPSTQEKHAFDQNFHVENAVYTAGGILAWDIDKATSNSIMSLSTDNYAIQMISLPVTDPCQHIHVNDNKLFLCSYSKRVYSLSLPGFNNMISTRGSVPAPSSCIFTSPTNHVVVVGMENGKLAVFKSIAVESSPLTGPPVIVKADLPDRKKHPVVCGLVHNDIILWAKGSYLIGTRGDSMQVLFCKMPSETRSHLRGVVYSENCLWVWYESQGDVIICDPTSGNALDSIQLKSLLSDSIGESHASSVTITAVTVGPNAIWMGTTSGHLLGFNPVTFCLLTAVRQHCSVGAVVSTPVNALVVFGYWSCGDTLVHKIGGFSVWQLHMNK